MNPHHEVSRPIKLIIKVTVMGLLFIGPYLYFISNTFTFHCTTINSLEYEFIYREEWEEVSA